MSLKYYIQKFIKKFPVKKFQFYNDEIVIYTNNNVTINLLLFLKLHLMCQYKVLTCISCVDYFKKINRFEIVYELLSIIYNNRIKLKITTNELLPLRSSEKIYQAANWCESEIFDMFGVFFLEHSSLKKILTDYGFIGYPLRKDFPLNGYVEIKYNYKQKKIASESIEFAHEYRTFDYNNPWLV